MLPCSTTHSFFFFNDTATTEIYTLSLHDALPISITGRWADERPPRAARAVACECRRGAAVPRQLPGEPAGHRVLDRDGAPHPRALLPAHLAARRVGLLGGRGPVGRVQRAHGRDRGGAPAGDR